MNQSSKLWSVEHTASIRSYTAESLWVIADGAEVAARKARRFLKKQGDVKVVITAVTSRGTIDVF